MAQNPLTTFTLFPELPAELRDKIWSFTLLPPAYTGPTSPLIIHVSARTAPDLDYEQSYGHLGRTTGAPLDEVLKFNANPASYGGEAYARSKIPAALLTCRESRSEALRQVTLRFGGCCFDLRQDYLFLRERKGSVAPDLYGWVMELAAGGLLDGVENLAVEWKPEMDGQWIALLRSIPSIKKCIFVFDAWRYFVELVDPGIPWQLGSSGIPWHLPRGSHQFIVQEDDCQKIDALLAVDKVEHEKEWALRGAELEFEWKELLHRKSERMWKRYGIGGSYYERPGEDFFG